MNIDRRSFLRGGILSAAMPLLPKCTLSASGLGASVCEFGAVGDGITDDSEAIQSAINSIYASGGGMLLFPTGQYYLGSPLQMALSGDGAFPVWLVGEGTDPTYGSALITDQDINLLEITNTVLNVRNWRLVDLAFKGGRSAVYLKYASYGEMMGCLFTARSDTKQARVLLDSCSMVAVHECQFRHTETALQVLYGDGFDISHNAFGEDIYRGVDALRIDDAIICGNRFAGYKNRGIWWRGGRHSIISDNTFDTQVKNTYGIHVIEDVSAARVVGPTLIYGNSMRSRANEAQSGGERAIRCDGMESIQICHNSFDYKVPLHFATTPVGNCAGTIAKDNVVIRGDPINEGTQAQVV